CGLTVPLPLSWAEGVIGTLLLLFGLNWLSKAVLRFGSPESRSNQGKEIEEATRGPEVDAVKEIKKFDLKGFAISFSGVFLEGIEIIFIVTTVGFTHNFLSAAVGALASLLAVMMLGAMLRRPLSKLPTPALKYAAGIALTALGTFFAGEGVGVIWWQGQLSLLFLIVGYALLSGVTILLLRRSAGINSPSPDEIGDVEEAEVALASFDEDEDENKEDVEEKPQPKVEAPLPSSSGVDDTDKAESEPAPNSP
ncbi:MAG: hypothetical protein ACREN8_03155, partial [Candidatus Dormibacteraceae bacterium]